MYERATSEDGIDPEERTHEAGDVAGDGDADARGGPRTKS